MSGEITKEGVLIIKRHGIREKMQCPFCRDGLSYCTDKCALFDEPDYGFNFGEEHFVTLQLCHRELKFESLIDKR